MLVKCPMIQNNFRNVMINQHGVTPKERSSRKRSKDKTSQFNMTKSLRIQRQSTSELMVAKESQTKLIKKILRDPTFRLGLRVKIIPTKLVAIS